MSLPAYFKNTRGFSLVELLVVIAVIGIVASLAIPAILDIADKANSSKDRRNAQNVAVVAAAAKAAGVTNNLSSTNAIGLLQPPGVSIIRAGNEMTFAVSSMSSDEQTKAAVYLSNNTAVPNGAVIYVP